MMHLFLLLLLFIGCCFTSPTIMAKKHCKPLLVKLRNIQATQRDSHSLSRAKSLRKREDKARNIWWRCEQEKSKKQNKQKKKRKTKPVKYRIKSKRANQKNNQKTLKLATPFKTSHAVIIKSKYQGDKQRAWLRYYQQPIQCQRPKSLTEFATCSENKQTQRADFEQDYNPVEK